MDRSASAEDGSPVEETEAQEGGDDHVVIDMAEFKRHRHLVRSGDSYAAVVEGRESEGVGPPRENGGKSLLGE